MSTIEKAAEKLAARSKRGLGLASSRQNSGDTPAARDHADATDSRVADDIRIDALMQGKAQGFIQAPERFCDIDLTDLVAKGYLRPGEGRSQLAQEMRRIKRPLLLAVQKQQVKPDGLPPANLLMVTSSLPEEGKTFMSINLAISMAAELDRRVLLVDADVSKGDITEQLGILAHRGLSDILHETNYVSEDGVLTSNVERLSILPAGGNTDHTDELFASELMANVCTSLAQADPDRIVIFDSPPLLATTEAAVLARLMGQVVLVVEANKTPQDAVGQSIQLLDGCANVSLVLNKTTQRDSGSYGYGYGYTRAERRPAEAQNSPDSPEADTIAKPEQS